MLGRSWRVIRFQRIQRRRNIQDAITVQLSRHNWRQNGVGAVRRVECAAEDEKRGRRHRGIEPSRELKVGVVEELLAQDTANHLGHGVHGFDAVRTEAPHFADQARVAQDRRDHGRRSRAALLIDPSIDILR